MNTSLRKILFYSSIFILIFLIVSKTTDMYSIAAVGAIYEILWLPVLLMIFVIPVVVVVWLVKERFSLKSINFYSLLLCVINIVLLILL